MIPFCREALGHKAFSFEMGVDKVEHVRIETVDKIFDDLIGSVPDERHLL